MIDRLTRVKGIGVWTAHMFLIFALQRTDVLPTGDLGIRNAIRKAYGWPSCPPRLKWNEWPSRWRPYCTCRELVPVAQPGGEREPVKRQDE